MIEVQDPNAFTDEEICARCGFPGKDHRPPKSFAYAKSNSSSGGAHDVPISARTCNWSNPLTTCTAFCRQ